MINTDTIVRAIVVLALIAYSLLRLVRWFRHGMAKRVLVVPPPVGMFPQDSARVTGTLAPPPATPSTWLAGVTTLVVWVGANLLLAAVLFAVPALAAVPVLWRMFVQVFANFYLLPWAKRVGARRGGSQARLTERA